MSSERPVIVMPCMQAKPVNLCYALTLMLLGLRGNTCNTLSICPIRRSVSATKNLANDRSRWSSFKYNGLLSKRCKGNVDRLCLSSRIDMTATDRLENGSLLVGDGDVSLESTEDESRLEDECITREHPRSLCLDSKQLNSLVRLYQSKIIDINKVFMIIITYLFTQICKHLCYFKILFILCNIFRNYKFSKLVNIKKI